jgi:phytoene dehydrogenase-like protein
MRTSPRQVCACVLLLPVDLDTHLQPSGVSLTWTNARVLPSAEPYEIWEKLDRKSAEYAQLKRERAQPLYDAIKKFIPDIEDRIEVQMIGSPLTHERFLRRHRGTYGPELAAGQRDFPGAKTPVEGLLCCGDSTWPGIGVPAVAGSGIAAAHAIVGWEAQRELLDELRANGVMK